MGDSWLETDGTRTAGGAVGQTRIERDPLGEMPVPVEALWGIQTERARQNFPISHLRPLPAFVDAVIQIKKAAALSNKATGRLDAKLADAIVGPAGHPHQAGGRPPPPATRARAGPRRSCPMRSCAPPAIRTRRAPARRTT